MLADHVRVFATKHQLLGRCLVAEEGVNGTFEGETTATEAFVKELLQDERLSDMQVKWSEGTGKAFKKLKVKVRPQIVGTGFDASIDPRKATAPRVSAEELRSWYSEGKDFVVIDMRNTWEYASGHFKNSIDPGLEYSRDLPKALPKLEPYKDKKILTVCTGGVRCESMSAYLMAHGFTDVHQLENGMHGYMETYPGQDFEGTLYTFDERVTMHFGGKRTVVGQCSLCAAPTEVYRDCAYPMCHNQFLVCEGCVTQEGAFCKKECREAVVGKSVTAEV